MGKLDGKVALITGAARGQGRSHAELFAQEGADIIAVDLCAQVDTVAYPMATPDDLEQTVKLVEKHGRRIVARQADVRDFEAMKRVVAEGVAELGRLDFVLANAGIMPIIGDAAHTMAAWHDAIDIMLTGVFNTVEAAIPTLLEQDQGGAIVITSSSAGLKVGGARLSTVNRGSLGYAAAKHGVVGLMRAWANALAERNIRVNTVHPTGVNSPMVVNEQFARYTTEHPEFGQTMQNLPPSPLVEPIDISRAMLYLCSEDGRYVTGITLSVDAGLVVG
ncbi:(-)-trans-carveol dehydrogenase [Mycolicibacterium hassiacum DSM 44199]|uniref:(-)-trans-carveol dehydrogenase n=1 Tax=Mycolicibacterium hassiacum (strain DSM 44199 / CIP 105218 / JCM 12690 / 3849) TaxID=1122247 RepID=K5BIM0_MYCHD|nr:mycofactocin-coupled SDR family oxidoreductase [Mycolicibacterium hassiacum]EKF21599.1 (-)-trans-carveol dehydrogenase [Mycolicibacterium hassiacum DSM 44199]MBX5487986.1 mycofactocin-coupled SDR family oxidoreductase [Mycolicibacterium hassiacum]MDA4084309.1 3-ketoacyl-ACP reductase [Mycolicibacterium hassiacum DSM 44199]VCT91318.1 putative oxidoreductase [Mycolicibacterium hassiacum DSM 44199]